MPYEAVAKRLWGACGRCWLARLWVVIELVGVPASSVPVRRPAVAGGDGLSQAASSPRRLSAGCRRLGWGVAGLVDQAIAAALRWW
jgi:hypothetical protein